MKKQSQISLGNLAMTVIAVGLLVKFVVVGGALLFLVYAVKALK
jgi:hypothetical protein